ncbi:hypothetical protein [Chitinimonas sp. JJ19]|uniref:hypothetical protein n=1 Tax=Chitinimonas sp. JJ19 TaxID=3109352 RepID=UPI00300101AC
MHQTTHPGTRVVLCHLCCEDVLALYQAMHDAAGKRLTGSLGNIVQAGLRRDGQMARGR